MSIKTIIPNHFIIIDDDPISNLLGRIIIRNQFPDSLIITFTLPQEGLAYIESEYSKTSNLMPVILFLDINMPVWSGWDFLEHFEKLHPLKTSFKIYIMSSSIDENDMARAAIDKNVREYIKKPISKSSFEQILEDYQK